MVWEVLLVEQVDRWFLDLAKTDPDSAEQVEAAINVLEREGPTLGTPSVKRIESSELHHMKELRPGSTGSTEIRVLFAFDPVRRAVLLLAGNKAGSWNRWVPIADARYKAHLREMEGGSS